jgi:nucleoside-diphosphate-sugar epimerase
MRIFVTGGTGFIGSHFLNAADQAGYTVRAVRRRSSVSRVPAAAPVEWLTRDLDAISEADVEGCDAVVHLACHSVNTPYDNLENCLYWNVVIASRFLEVCRRAGIRRYILAGSCFEYGRSAERYDYVPTDAPLEPIFAYAASKAAATIAAIAFAQQHAVSLSVLRLFQVYGQGEAAGRLWPSLRDAAKAGRDFPMSAGEQVRDFVPVSMAADALVHELALDVALGRPIVRNVGTGQATTILEFARHWWAHWGARGRLLPGALPYRSSDLKRCVAKL